jgi:hypothetical protein
MFIIFQNNVVDFSYSMLLGRPWLKDVKVAHDWGSNIVTMQGNGIVRTIIVTKCYNVITVKMVTHMKKKISCLLQSQNYFQ